MFALLMNKAEEFTNRRRGQGPDRAATRITTNAYNELRGMGETITASIRKSPYMSDLGRAILRSDEPVAIIAQFMDAGDWAQSARYASLALDLGITDGNKL